MTGILPVTQHYAGIPGNVWLGVLTTIAVVTFLIVTYNRFRLLCAGNKDPRFSSVKERLKGLVLEGFLQRRQPRYPVAGVLHIVIFWGFMVLGLRSLNLLVEGLFPGTTLPFLKGDVGVVYDSMKDLFELTTLAACIGAVYHRAVVKPKRYDGSHRFEAYLVLSLIGILMLSDLVYEGAGYRLQAEETGWAVGSVAVSYGLSFLAPQVLKTVHVTGYWVHMIVFFVFLNLLPLSKHFHIITALPNVFFKKQVRGRLKPATFEPAPITELTYAGVGKVEDFTWKHMLDFFSCTECGRCTDNCPANLVGRNLSPKHMTMRLRDHVYGTSKAPRSTGKETPLIGDIIATDELWACTTCGACEEQCPVFIEHVDKIVDMRRHLVLMQSDFPDEILQMFRNLEIFSDPMGMGPARRTEWAEGLPVESLSKNNAVDVVYWVGCFAAADDRYRSVARTLWKIMTGAGIRFEILGAAERCCGDFARRLGNEYLFETLARKNIEALKACGAKQIVTTCPHCYNTLKNEYPDFGLDVDVLHHTELLTRLIRDNKVTFKTGDKARITYHDACYLGRYNQIYLPPREILGHIPGVDVIEPERNCEKGLCCGGGGGYMWLVEQGQRVNEVRAAELSTHAPDLVATACPYCMTMLQDGLDRQKDTGTPVQCMDLMEIVDRFMTN